MEPGPGVGGPGPGVIPVPGQGQMNPGLAGFGPMQAAYYAGSGGGGPEYMAACIPAGGLGMAATSQISFLGEEGIQVSWDVSGAGMFDSSPLLIPGKQDFYQGAIYRLQVSSIPGRETVVLYPTLEVAPVTPRTDAYLAHAPVPVQFTEEDFDQVLSGNFVTKVIYLPDPEFTEVALAGVETLVSTRLDPGVDPIAEADRRGSILAILRMGNKDLSRSAGMGPRGGGDPRVVPAQFQLGDEMVPAGETIDRQYLGEYDGGFSGDEYIEGVPFDGGDNGYGDGYYGPGYGAGGLAMNMPVGAPTAGNRPQNVPPHQVPNMAPHWGMPISGTPIGLPGPPHIPLGVPAGLKSHKMHNRTRVVLPEPVEDFKVSVKQRPGLNYPAPVKHVHVDEVNRAPSQLHGGTVAPLVPSAIAKAFGRLRSAAHNADCQCEHCQ